MNETKEEMIARWDHRKKVMEEMRELGEALIHRYAKKHKIALENNGHCSDYSYQNMNIQGYTAYYEEVKTGYCRLISVEFPYYHDSKWYVQWSPYTYTLEDSGNRTGDALADAGNAP